LTIVRKCCHNFPRNFEGARPEVRLTASARQKRAPERDCTNVAIANGVNNMAITARGIKLPGRIAQFAVAVFLAALVSANGPSLSAQNSIPEQPPLLAAQPNPPAPKAELAPLPPEELGDLHMVRRRYQAAIEAYLQVLPKTASLWNKMGIANQQMFNLPEAKKCYETSLKMNPKNSDVINNLATVYYSLKEYSYAERLYRKALKESPKSALIYKNLGTALLAENKFKKGWECYQEALDIDPEVFERNNLLRIGEPTPAQKRGAMNYYLAKSYAHVGMADRAVGYLRMAIDEGFTDRKKVLADKEFASLRGFSAFEQLLSEQQVQ
jgi:tetratricopeptide (TPR) repeat protein